MAKKTIKVGLRSTGTEPAAGDVNISYKGLRIAGLSESSTAVLETENTIVTGDIQVEFNKPAGGDTYAVARTLLDNTATEYIDDTITILRRGAFFGCSNLTTAKVHNVEYIKSFGVAGVAGAFASCGVSTLALPKLRISSALTDGYRLFEGASSLTAIDLGQLFDQIPAATFAGCANLSTVIFRSPTLVSLGNTNAFNNTPFASGGTGGTIYIPKSLYDHLGDGTANDYKAATNWSIVDAYNTITWAPIEGSIYENAYADGTPIPTT